MVALSPTMMLAGETVHERNCAAGCSSTVMVVVAVAWLALLRAVKVYCVVLVGVTALVPFFGSTEPSSLMITESAFKTCQSIVEAWPARMLVGLAWKRMICTCC